ncbi:hypothetical protein PG993_005637 [Apiospora rasikravindrae]|uniref:Rhodopsin domain-containing protein n=1 Tax=Apiospora rasikravindrae TaxID=990691 RepID=A0ABR1TG59_9PEZI
MEASNRAIMAPEDIDHSLDHEGRIKEIITILSVFSAVSTLVVALRIYTRAIILRSFGTDDAVIIGALILTIGSAVAIGLEGKFGLGTHTWVQPLEDFIPYMKSFYVSIILYNVGLCLIKVSILLQYRRIFTQKLTQWMSGGLLTFILAWTVTLSVLLPLVCYPVDKFWEPSLPGSCVDQLAVWYVMAGVNIVTDFAIFVIPLPVIKSLQLPTKQKMLLVVVFGLGLFTCIISCLRIRTLKMASLTKDPNWDNTDAALWSFIELCIGMLTSSLPTLRPPDRGSPPAPIRLDRPPGLPGLQRRRVRSLIEISKPGLIWHRPHGAKERRRRRWFPLKSAASDSLEELHQYHYGAGDNKDLELGIGGGRGDVTAGYSVNVSCGENNDAFEMQSPAAAAGVGAPKRTKSRTGGNGITATTVVTREYEPSARNSP